MKPPTFVPARRNSAQYHCDRAVYFVALEITVTL